MQTAFGSTDMLSESYAREVAQLFLTGRQLWAVGSDGTSGSSPPTPSLSARPGGSPPSLGRSSLTWGELPSARTPSFEFW